MIRNRTKLFIQLRNVEKEKRIAQSAGGGGDDHDYELLQNEAESVNWKALKDASNPPNWVKDIEIIDKTIATIQTKIKELNGLHTRRLKVNFEDDETLQEREIYEKTQAITDHFRQAEGVLRKFSADDGKGHAAELAVRKNIQHSVAKRLQGLNQSFRNSQKTDRSHLKYAQEYMRKLRGNSSGRKSAFDDVDEEKMHEIPDDPGFTQKQKQEMENMAQLVDMREQEIVNLAKSIEELAAIFKELAVMVIDQGTILDRIDYNMESAVDHMEAGIQELEKAEVHQKNALPMKCIILLVILIIVALITLIALKTSKK